VDLGAAGNDNTFGWGRVAVRNALNYSYTNFWFVPTAVNVSNASIISGGLNEVRFSDNLRLHIRGNSVGAVANPPMIEFTTTVTNSQIGTLNITLEGYSLLSSVIQRIEAWDYVANGWAIIDTRLVSTTENSITITPASPQRFRQAGTGQMRVRVVYNGVFPGTGITLTPFDMFVDRLNWRAMP
jgi:hypothetical protein